jgi:hypothetical protein
MGIFSDRISTLLSTIQGFQLDLKHKKPTKLLAILAQHRCNMTQKNGNATFSETTKCQHTGLP